MSLDFLHMAGGTVIQMKCVPHCGPMHGVHIAIWRNYREVKG